jgi:hypothetical protein
MIGVDFEIQRRAPGRFTFSHNGAKQRCACSSESELGDDIQFLEPRGVATMLQCPDKRDIRDSGTAAINIGNKNHAATRTFDNTSHRCSKLWLGYLNVVLPKLGGEQQKDIANVFRCSPDYVWLRLH